MKTKKLLGMCLATCAILAAQLSIAQTRPSVLSPDQIRTQAGMIRQYKELLASPDASVRYAAVSEMLNSKDNALRVLAFDMAFQSADSSIRALALKERVLSMGSIVVEPSNDSVASQLVDKRLNRIAVQIGKIDLVRGLSTIEVQHVLANGSFMYGNVTVAGEEVVIDIRDSVGGVYIAGRFGLSDSGKLVGGLQWTLPKVNERPATGLFPAFISVN